MSLPDSVAFTHSLRVRWSEVDPQGVVFNPNYFVYADVAVMEFFRSLGVIDRGLPDMLESYVVDARAAYRAPSRFDDVLTLKVTTGRIGRSSYEIAVDVMRDADLLVEVRLTYVRAREGRSESLTEAFRALLEKQSGDLSPAT